MIGRALLLRSLPAPRPGPARTQASASSSGGAHGIARPQKGEQRPGRWALVPRHQPRPAGSHDGLPYPEPRPSQAQPRRHAGDAGPAHAADSRQQSAGLSSNPAPGRSRRPLLKDRQAAQRTKPARGHMRPRRCQSRLAIQPGHPESSNRRPGRAQVQRRAVTWGPQPDRAASPADPAVRFTREHQHHLPRSRPALRAKVRRARPRNYNADHPSVDQSAHASHLLRTSACSPGGGGVLMSQFDV